MRKFVIILTVISVLLGLTACQPNTSETPTVTVSSLRDVSAIKLNFRFENDVPAPPEAQPATSDEEKNNTIQLDFDQNRPGETLERTIPSPDKKRFLVVYQKLDDLQATYRLDMYSADGKLLRKITPDGLAVYYPDTIVWSPDSNNVAFVGMVRLGQTIPVPTPTPDAPIPPNLDDENSNVAGLENNTESEANTDDNTAPTVEQPKQVLTFRTEQIYICNSDGGDLKPLTQNEGYRYFYFVWSPDSSMLVSLVATWREFDFMNARADQQGEIFIPMGRPRLVEKNGRIRLLDDNLTSVHPVWSPDSSKIALAFDKEIRIYDAIGDAPTQAAIPLRNPLLFAAQSFDKEMQSKEASEISEANSNTNSKVNSEASPSPTANVSTPQGVDTLPDENSLVSFNPIVELEWTEDKMLYLKTGYIKEFKDSTQSTRSYLRWHRLLFSPQAIKLN